MWEDERRCGKMRGREGAARREVRCGEERKREKGREWLEEEGWS